MGRAGTLSMLLLSSQRRVINLDGVVNWDAVHAYQVRDLYSYMCEQRICWLVDFDEFVGNFAFLG